MVLVQRHEGILFHGFHIKDMAVEAEPDTLDIRLIAICPVGFEESCIYRKRIAVAGRDLELLPGVILRSQRHLGDRRVLAKVGEKRLGTDDLFLIYLSVVQSDGCGKVLKF